MPIYEHACNDCGYKFEALFRSLKHHPGLHVLSFERVGKAAVRLRHLWHLDRCSADDAGPGNMNFTNPIRPTENQFHRFC